MQTGYLTDEDYETIEVWCNRRLVGTSDRGAMLRLPDNEDVLLSLATVLEVLQIEARYYKR